MNISNSDNSRNMYPVNVSYNETNGVISITNPIQTHTDSRQDYLYVEAGHLPTLIIRNPERCKRISALETFEFQNKKINKGEIRVVQL